MILYIHSKGEHPKERKEVNKMIKLANGEHTFFTTESGVRYWVMNLYGTYRVEREGKVRKVTEEIKKAIELV